MKMNHVGISVTDVDRSIEFYRDMLGMEPLCPVFPFGDDPSFGRVMGLANARGRMCAVQGGTVQLELFEFSRPEPAPQDPDYPVADRGS